MRNEIKYIYAISGGTGSLGKALTPKLLKENARIVRIISRDEEKQRRMQHAMQDERLRFFVGDVRDEARMISAFENVDCVIHAAAMKQVPACEYNPFEAVKTNILGTQNVISACIENRVKVAVLVSTDKAVDPVNLYGATKLVAEKLWINANESQKHTKFVVVKYGNVLGSRGSVIPIFLKQAKEKGEVTITDPDMTRFVLTLDQASDIVGATCQLHLMNPDYDQYVMIPANLPAVTVKVIADVVAPKASVKIIGAREGEKKHEKLDEGYTSDKAHQLSWQEFKEIFDTIKNDIEI